MHPPARADKPLYDMGFGKKVTDVLRSYGWAGWLVCMGW